MKISQDQQLVMITSEGGQTVTFTCCSVPSAERLASVLYNNVGSVTIPLVTDQTPKDFQKALCERLQARAQVQQIPAKGSKRNRMFLDSLAGACYALEVLGSDQLAPMLSVAFLASARGAEVVDHIAKGEPI